MQLNDLIKYYNACYQADSRGLSINNFFANKVADRIIFEKKEELVNDFLPYAPIDEELAKDIQKTTKLYEKEKELIYCSLFIIGKKIDFKNRIQKICAPLFIYPAEIIVVNELYYIKIDKSQRRINYTILNQIDPDDTNNAALAEELYNSISDYAIDGTSINVISKILNKYIDVLNTDELFTFPELYSEKNIKKLLQTSKLQKQNNFKIIPASGSGIINKSTDTRGIINELDEISESNDFSTPIKTVFNFEDIKAGNESIPGKVPSILSQSQENVLRYCTKYPFNLIVGPPGTGKSFTIATLAIEQMSKGNSVLIASGTNQAVDVIYEKINKEIGIEKVIVRAGRKQYLKDLKTYLSNLLNGHGMRHYNITSRESLREVNKLSETIKGLEKTFLNRVDEEIKWGEFFADNLKSKNIFKKLKKKYINWQNTRSDEHWKIIKELNYTLQKNQTKIADYIHIKQSEQVDETLKKHRPELMQFYKAIKTTTGTRQESLFNKTNFNVILETFPIWLVKLSDIYRVLPLRKELFDVAIIDEATQCNIAATIPILQRAKHVIFTGDPNQLRHVSFLSRVKQKIFADKFNLQNINPELLNYRDNSILDVVTYNTHNQEQIIFLDEHFRSTPAIIRFSNKMFYSSALKIMTSRPDIPKNEGIEIIRTKGMRNKKGYNVKEAGLIIEKLKEIINNQIDMNETICQSIGILSPFRNQVDYISSQIRKDFTIAELEKHNIRVGTAFGFQGEERDIMFLSFAVDNNSHSMSFRHIDKKDVFNVSITRARAMLYIYHSVNIPKLSIDSFFRKFLEFFPASKDIAGNASSTIASLKENQADFRTKDDFAREVAEEFHKKGFKIWIGFPVAGLKIDLVIQKDNIIRGIDLIGFPGEFQEAFSIERYKIIYRAGIEIIPLPYTYWLTDREKCLNLDWVD